MNPRYRQVAKRAGHRCEYCRAPEIVFNFPHDVEHVIPTSRGGSDDLPNLALGCRACNAFKAIAVEGYDAQTDIVAPLFHPRRDNWSEHFRVDRETGKVLGLSGTGRVTVESLRMNSAAQMAARQNWMRLGLFP